MEVFAGEKSFKQFQDWLPQETVDAMAEYRVSIKGPLTTPVGGGIRSLNVRYDRSSTFTRVSARFAISGRRPVKEPEVDGDLRENTEDVYAGIEWKAGSLEAEKIAAYLRKEFT
jgi:isocitrate dehydrogenase